MILTTPIVDEVRAKIVSVLNLEYDIVVTKATKFIRFDWRSLVQQYEKLGFNGLKAPWIVVRVFPSERADWGQANMCQSIPIEIFLIENESNEIRLRAREDSTGTTVKVDSTTGLFVDQRIFFPTVNEWRTITAVNSHRDFTVNSSVRVVTNDALVSDITKDVEVKIEKLRTEFSPGKTFTSFQIVDDPTTDLSDMNPANEYFLGENFNLLVGSCYISALVGETLA